MLWRRTTAGNEPVDLLLHPPRAIKLHVVDAQTGAQLDGLEVRRGTTGVLDVSAVPSGHAIRLGDGLSSPLTLTPVDGVEVLWVRRAGYAWSHVVVDHREDVDRCVALHAACQARVRLDGPPRSAPTEVVVDYFDGDPQNVRYASLRDLAAFGVLRATQTKDWVAFDLPPGRWVARLSGADLGPYDGVQELFETHPGAVTTVVLKSRTIETPLDLALSEKPQVVEVELVSEQPATVEGYVHLAPNPPPLDRDAVVFAATAVAKPRPDGGPGCVVRFANVLPGPYRLVLGQTRWSTPLVVSAGDVGPRVFMVPPLVPARFAFHDALTGKPLNVRRVFWSATGLGLLSEDAVRAPNASTWRVDSHADEFDFELFVGDSSLPTKVTARVATRSEVTRVDVELGASLAVALRDATASVLARQSWWHRVEIFDEHGAPISLLAAACSAPLASQAEFRVPHAGRFTVRLPPLNSHHAAPPQIVELASGAAQRLEFQLTALGCR